jgi:hypothetical protein
MTRKQSEKKAEIEREALEAQALRKRYSSLDGIANELGCSVATVKNRLKTKVEEAPPSPKLQQPPPPEPPAPPPEEAATKDFAIRAAQQAMIDAQNDVAKCRAMGDNNGARQAQRIFLTAATLLGKLVSKDDAQKGTFVSEKEIETCRATLKEKLLRYAREG